MQTIIYPILPFDASISGTIKFSWLGNQAFKNRCIIRNNETNAVVYDKTIESFKFEHKIDLASANLVNGTRYNAYITVFDINDAESDLQSVGESFICLKVPVFSFNNISEGGVISTSSYNFVLSYSQENGELLDSWSMQLYTRSHSLLSSSEVKYTNDNISYTFSGFSNKNEYCIRAIGKTINGIELDTGYINFSVTYASKDVFSLLEPINLCDIGAIYLGANIVSSEGHLLKLPPIFIDNDFIDLRDNELTYSEGFNLNGDFSLVKVFYGALPNQEILRFNSEDTTVYVTYRVGKFTTNSLEAHYELRAVSYGLGDVAYVIFSNIIPLPADNDKIGLCVVRQGQLYDIQICNLGKAV